MGPSMSIDGVIGRGDLGQDDVAMASMGPSMSIDGVLRHRHGRPSGERRFNGAVDEHRRSH